MADPSTSKRIFTLCPFKLALRMDDDSPCSMPQPESASLDSSAHSIALARCTIADMPHARNRTGTDVPTRAQCPISPSINLYFHCMIRHETFRDPKTTLALAGAGMRDSFHIAFFSPSRKSDSFGKMVGSLHPRHPVLQFHSVPGLSLMPPPTGGFL